VIQFPNGKINLGLNITAKRPDGYHNLETVFYPIPINDVLEIVLSSEMQFVFSGLNIPGDVKDNLCNKAYGLMKLKFPSLPPVATFLHKRIPLGAGLGGGSSDGAFMLQLLKRKFNLDLSQQELASLAAQLGSDCPFFMLNRPCFAHGRGELIETIELDLSEWSIVLLHPGISIGSAWAFSAVRPSIPAKSIREIIRQPIESWRKELVNDFELPVFAHYPELAAIKTSLYAKGAIYASLTGSGSSLYGIFEQNNAGEIASFQHQRMTVSVDIIP
jgi:4-diphosphocytidyl-2-C-methyl-D-erythritol kinase